MMSRRNPASRRTKETSAPLSQIRLELASTPDTAPSAECGYDLIAPLDPDGYLDAGIWFDHRTECHVRHFGSGAADEQGRLIHTCKRRWILHAIADGSLWHIGTHRFVEGGTIVVAASDGVARPFRVVRLQPLPVAAVDP
jgi:hypothetical protein